MEDSTKNKDNTRRDRVREALGRIYEDSPPLLTEYLRRYRQDPKSRVFVPLAEAYRRLGKVDEAIEVCLKGLEHHPDFQGGRIALAKCYVDKKKFLEAEDVLKTVIRAVPENLLAHRLMGDVCLSLGEGASALHSYQMASRLAPNDVGLAERIREIQHQVNSGTFLGEKPPLAADEVSKSTPIEEEIAEKRKEDLSLWLTQIGLEDEMSKEEVGSADSAKLDRILGMTDGQEAFKVESLGNVFGCSTEKEKEITTQTLGDLYLSQGQYDQALKIFERVYQSYPSRAMGEKIELCRMKMGVETETIIRKRKITALQDVLERVRQKRVGIT